MPAHEGECPANRSMRHGRKRDAGLTSLACWLVASKQDEMSEKTGHDEVTIERENCTKPRQTGASMKQAQNPHKHWRFAYSDEVMQTPAKPPKMPFHGGNAGSNPAGDAKVSTSRQFGHIEER